MAALELFGLWVMKNLGLIGIALMVILGSLVAHLKSYEASAVEWTTRQHFWGIVRRLIYGTMAGFLVYFLRQEYHWSEPLSHVITGIAAIFASDAFDFLWVVIKAKARKILGLENGNDNQGK